MKFTLAFLVAMLSLNVLASTECTLQSASDLNVNESICELGGRIVENYYVSSCQLLGELRDGRSVIVEISELDKNNNEGIRVETKAIKSKSTGSS